MPTTRTSENSPLGIDAVTPGTGQGRIGITLCPGKTDRYAMSGPVNRDLPTDLDAIRDWGATAVVSLITDEEIDYLRVSDLEKKVLDRHMEWWHLPIPDVEPPGSGFEREWTVAGEAIRDRLRLGFDVLVHCKGGLGRAGTIAARLLVELGADPDDAIRSVRGARSLDAIETTCQEEHVRQCRPRSPAVPPRTEDSVRDRALGAFLGLAVGDAVGTTLEFCARDTKRVEDMVGGGPFGLAPGGWTDDTSMALALADSLAACGALDCRDLMDRFVRWWRHGDYSHTGHCFDIGVTTRQALKRYEETGDPCAGSTDPDTAGNGSLMRLAPIALRFWNDRPRLIATAAAQSRTTHGTAEAVDACRAFAELLADAIAGSPRTELLAPRSFNETEAVGTSGSCQGCARREDTNQEWAEAIAVVMADQRRKRPRNEKPRNQISSSGYVVDTVEAALWSVARTGNFRNAILLAANLADDADTVAAVTGQLAGALYGLDGIPDAWLARVAWKDRLLAAGRRLLPSSPAEREPPGE